MLRITTHQGKGGKWRYKLTWGSTHRSMSSIRGYHTQYEAELAAIDDFSREITIEGVDGPLYAGGRDFDTL